MDLSNFYSLIYKNRNKILVLDDFDSPLQDPNCVNLLKSMTDSYKKKTVSFPMVTQSSQQGTQKSYDIPQKFDYDGKVIILTNLKLSSIENSLKSRAPSIEITYNAKETLKALGDLKSQVHPDVDNKIKTEVLNHMIKLYSKNKKMRINFRTFQTCVDVRLALPDTWKSMAKTILSY